MRSLLHFATLLALSPASPDALTDTERATLLDNTAAVPKQRR
jgi:hypothetical protein